MWISENIPSSGCFLRQTLYISSTPATPPEINCMSRLPSPHPPVPPSHFLPIFLPFSPSTSLLRSDRSLACIPSSLLHLFPSSPPLAFRYIEATRQGISSGSSVCMLRGKGPHVSALRSALFCLFYWRLVLVVSLRQ